MDDAPLWLLYTILGSLLLLSAFFSSSETAMMSLNRYRLKHLRKKHGGARQAYKLLKRPDRLIGIILIGNNLVNILASAIATVIAIRLAGDAGIIIATLLLTLAVLIFSEVTPKTVAALHPEGIAFTASYVLRPLLTLFYPFVWLVNHISNGLLRIFGVNPKKGRDDGLSKDEIRTVVDISSQKIPEHQDMLMNILDLETVTVNDIMIPRNEVEGIDLEDDLDKILEQLSTTSHTRLPVFQGDINRVVGVLHMRNLAQLIQQDRLTKPAILQVIHEAYFVPESTPLQTQLLNFQGQSRRLGVVVDEYGDVQGIVTLEDILEEIVGEFESEQSLDNPHIHPQPDGRLVIEGAASIRDLNRSLSWHLPSDGPKTLNGLITEALETIPDSSVCLKIGPYRLETLETEDNRVTRVLMWQNTRTKDVI